LDNAALILHCASERHKENEKLLQEDIKCLSYTAVRACQAISPVMGDVFADLDQVSYPPWKDAVHAELYRYITAPSTKNETAEEELFERPLKRLKTCLQSERLTLVALAVWKSKCMRQMPPVADFDAAFEWMRSEWKTYKGLQRDSNDMYIVVDAVRQFLE
jgi:hypothetical protein